MAADMTKDMFTTTVYGKLALLKMGEVPENFRLFEAGWLGDGLQREVMEIKGAEFRITKAGPNKGKLSIPVPGTEKVTWVTAKEMELQKII